MLSRLAFFQVGMNLQENNQYLLFCNFLFIHLFMFKKLHEPSHCLPFRLHLDHIFLILDEHPFGVLVNPLSEDCKQVTALSGIRIEIQQVLGEQQRATGCSLNIVFFSEILRYFELWPFSVFPRCQCVYTHQAG